MTSHAYDLAERYRDLGGNLAFLSANNFFRRVDRVGNTLHLVDLWRNLGRPEASLIGVQYLACCNGFPFGPYRVKGRREAQWFFAGTGLVNGSTFGHGGIEIDARGSSSPGGTVLLADIPDLYGPGRSAEMTFYGTDAGAKVFAAGALNFSGSALNPMTSALLENLWRRLATAPPRPIASKAVPEPDSQESVLYRLGLLRAVQRMSERLRDLWDALEDLSPDDGLRLPPTSIRISVAGTPGVHG